MNYRESIASSDRTRRGLGRALLLLVLNYCKPVATGITQCPTPLFDGIDRDLLRVSRRKNGLVVVFLDPHLHIMVWLSADASKPSVAIPLAFLRIVCPGLVFFGGLVLGTCFRVGLPLRLNTLDWLDG
jgi:hypothetical protein